MVLSNYTQIRMLWNQTTDLESIRVNCFQPEFSRPEYRTDSSVYPFLDSSTDSDQSHTCQTCSTVAYGISYQGCPDHPGRRILVMTEAGWRAVERTAPLIAGAHNAAFAPLNARDFKALRRLAPKLDAASEAAVEILARRAGERPWRSLRELLRLSEKMGVK